MRYDGPLDKTVGCSLDEEDDIKDYEDEDRDKEATTAVVKDKIETKERTWKQTNTQQLLETPW